MDKDIQKTSTKPFLKWAGGKTQLLPAIKKALPKNIREDKWTYIEPFTGSGAVFFSMLNTFPSIEKAVINDVNPDLINSYEVIANESSKLISILEIYQKEYHRIDENAEKKKTYFYSKRKLFNSRKSDRITQAALLIFLNRTCFNGLFRMNKNNEFNVPIGSYKKPTICDAENILAVSNTLQKVKILCGDFEKTLKYANTSTFFYFDPPYKPLSKTSNFNTYAGNNFNDSEQIRLHAFCKKLDENGHKWMLSNSDVKETDNKNNFFDELYKDFNIKRVKAKRNINSKGSKRGAINELIITNY